MVSSEWVGRRGEFRDTRNNFAILARLNGGTTCSRGVERAGSKVPNAFRFLSRGIYISRRVDGYAGDTLNRKRWTRDFTWDRSKMDILSNNNRNFDE